VILSSEFQTRRAELLKRMPADSIMFLCSASHITRNGDAHFPFRQDSDFWYFTGLNEVDAVTVFAPQHSLGEYGLFCLPKDPNAERWTGPRMGLDAAIKHHGASVAYSRDTFDAMLGKWLYGRTVVYLPFSAQPEFSKHVLKVMQQFAGGKSFPWELLDIGSITAPMRLIKSPAEQEIMRQAAHYSAHAHVKLMEQCKPGIYEYELAAQFCYASALQGATEMAYPPIVAGGKNACILHYTDNRALLDKNACVLVDAGCEFHNYASDITRTFPVSGVFSGAQRDIYALVLKAQLAAIHLIKPGATWALLENVVGEIFVEGLLDLGLLKGSATDLLAKKRHQQWFVHGLGHWLGLDVHDVGAYKIEGKSRPFEPGMVLTIEPGLYFDVSDTSVKSSYRGIGIRIEDDVLVTETGHEVLSSDAPKNIDVIESVMRG